MEIAEKWLDIARHALRCLLMIMSIAHLTLFSYNVLKLLSYHNIQIDFGEGVLLGNAERLRHFKTIYPDIEEEVILGVYPPVYQLLSALAITDNIYWVKFSIRKNNICSVNYSYSCHNLQDFLRM